MKKSYLIFIVIWIFFLSIIAFIGISSILKFDYSAFFSLLYVIGSIMLINNLFSKIKNIEIKKILTNIKTISSLDYSNLNNITKIDFLENGDFYVHISNNNKKTSLQLETHRIPKNQEMLLELDKTYDGIKLK